MTLLISVLLLFQTAFGAQSPRICEVIPNATNPRQADMHFPDGRLISVVGHQHPRRHGENRPESTFVDLLETDPTTIQLFKGKNLDGPVTELLKEAETAIGHFEEDYKNLESFLEEGLYQHIGIEYHPARVQTLLEASDRMYQKSASIFEAVGISDKHRRPIRLLALTPPGLLKQERPSLFKGRNIFSPEGFSHELKQYSEEQCPKNESFNGPPPIQIFQLFIDTLTSRTKDPKINDNAYAAMSKVLNEIALTPFVTRSSLAVKDVENIFLRAFPARLKRSEKKILEEYIQLLLVHSPLLKGCSPRDALIAKNLARQKGSSISFMGTAHLPGVTRFLHQECLQQIKGKPSTPIQGIP